MNEPTPTHAPCVLIIRDGWGENPNAEHNAFNAIKLARTPVADRLAAECPTTLIATSGEDVGLTDGTMGNSEVGHQNIGAGRVVDQEAVRISKACRNGELASNDAIVNAAEFAKEHDGSVHLLGICSDAGVHGQLVHLYALLDALKSLGCDRVFLHLFTDGRDTGPFTGREFLREVQTKLDEIGVGQIASVVGRYYAMDRDNRWERVARAHACLTGHAADAQSVRTSPTADKAIAAHYDSPELDTLKGDEFTPPTMIGEHTDRSRITDGDALIFYNYRGDRPREIMAAFVEPEFQGADSTPPSPDTGARGFDRGPKLDMHPVIMSAYSERLAELCDVAFPKPPKMRDILGAHLADLGLTQFRCAETEKFPHVTFFFNDYRDDPFKGERREIIQSPKVATYDLQPEMSARGVADAVLRRLNADDCEPAIIVNFANGDMVGHTGNLDAAIAACETVDTLTGELLEAVRTRGGCAIVTADHGNAEQMYDPNTGSPHTAHTTYPVPLHVVGDAFTSRHLRSEGRLGDIAPTMLDMLGLERPAAMTGTSLLA